MWFEGHGGWSISNILERAHSHLLDRDLLVGKKVLSLMHIVEKYINLLSHRVAPWCKLVQIDHCFPSIVSLRRRKFLEMNNKKPRFDVESGNNHEGIKV